MSDRSDDYRGPNVPTRLLMEAAVRLAKKRNAASKRHVPSPSSVDNCTRRNWFSETGIPPSQDPDAESFFSAESGRLTESLITDVVNESGLGCVEPLTEGEREIPKVALARFNLGGGQFDQMMIEPGVRGEDADVVLLEYKRKGAFDILDLHRKGLREAIARDYQQVQLLMATTKLVRCLYIAVNWDRGALTSSSRSWAIRPTGIYAEWIDAVPAAAVAAAQRAAMQTKYITTEKVAARVPRDYDPHGGQKADWHCRFCPWWKTCLAAEKYTK